MSKNRFQFGRTALICLLPAALLAGCGAKAAQPTLDPTVTVETEIAALDTLTLEQTYMAAVSADSSASVYPKVSAVVTALNVEVGDTVNAGDVLCRFEDTNSVGVSQAQAQLNYKELADSKHPKAKISGTISDVYVHNGDAVSAGSPIARIVSSNDISVDFLFPYASPDKFYVGQTATVFITGFAGSYTGTVSSVPDTTSTTSNGMSACTVRVTLKNPGNLTDSGSYTASAVIGSYTASAVIGSYTSYGQAALHMSGADTVYAKASGTISGFNKVASSTVSAGESLCTIVSDALDTQIRNAQLTVQSAGNAMENFTLTAPISGTVEAVNISKNNMASPSANAISAAAEALDFPAGVRVGEDTRTSMQNDELSTMVSALLASLFLVFLVMAVQFNSVKMSIMVMMKEMSYIVIDGLIASTALAMFLVPPFCLLMRG
ncbi:MAG: HlyD family efflux transporter periplasmic adaptor subunit, partial [Clostridiales bacterium]|nr:HlyD family efflux transporter periplasmic adaptor subunit [Clostridiales bacterium]